MSTIGDPVIYDSVKGTTVKPDQNGLFKYDFSNPDKQFEVLLKTAAPQNKPYDNPSKLSANDDRFRLGLSIAGFFCVFALLVWTKAALWVVSIVTLFIAWRIYIQNQPPPEVKIVVDEPVDRVENDGEYVKVGTVTELKKVKKKRVPVYGRDILIIYHNNEFMAIDAVCYHFGGPLNEGDIEDVDGVTCIECPWHHYKIDIRTGEGVSYTRGKVSIKGPRQRIHYIRVDDNDIFVSLNDDSEELPSDSYAFMGLYKYPTSKIPPKGRPNKEDDL